MDKLVKLRKEIERLKKCSEFAKLEYVDEGYTQNAFAEDCRILSFNKLLSFIDSMQEEPISEDLEKKLKDYVCHEWAGDPIVLVRHFANWQKERLLSKACKYLKDNIWRNLYFVNGEAGFPTAEFIKGFRKAMEE